MSMEGHDFSRAAKSLKFYCALAPEGGCAPLQAFRLRMFGIGSSTKATSAAEAATAFALIRH
jgi:hypothetical protein